jgi:RimJ/RimL family protein N-acetyltransferase
VLIAAKGVASHPQPALCLPVGRPPIALLRPVASADAPLLTEWRNRFAGAFLTEFVADDERTGRWLTDVVGPDDSRMLFMVENLDLRPVGHMGLAFIDWRSGRAEADNVVRGVAGPHGLFTRALDVMWQWGRIALGLTELAVRVRSDNEAIAFYERAGFREAHRVPLRRDGAAWVEDPSLDEGGLALVHMELARHGG